MRHWTLNRSNEFPKNFLFSFAHLGDGKTLGLLTNVTDYHYHQFRQITPALNYTAHWAKIARSKMTPSTSLRMMTAHLSAAHELSDNRQISLTAMLQSEQ